MSEQYPGGFVTKSPPTPSGSYDTSSAYGMWNLSQQAAYKAQGLWPTVGNQAPDAQFNYVTMLLHGDGTNGAANNTFLDSSTNNFTITRNGNTTQGSFSPYGSNWSNYFNGSTDYLSIASTSQLTLTGDYTVEAWLNVINTASGYKRVFQNAPGTEPSGYFYIFTNGTNVHVYNVDIGGLVNVGSFTGSSWFHLAVCRSGSTTKVFINGTQTYSYSGSTTFTNNGWYIGGGPASEFSNLYVSNHRVVVGTAIYTSAFTPSTVPLTAVTNTKLLTCQSNRFIDNSASPLTITVNSTPSVQRFNPFGTSTAYSTATIGGSGYFDGTGDYLTTPSVGTPFPAIGSSDNFSIEFWSYAFSSAHAKGVFDVNGYASGLMVRATPGSGVEIWMVGTQVVTSGSFKWSEWAHIVIQRYSGTTYIYINGTLNTTSTSLSGKAVSAGPAYIGVATHAISTELMNGYFCDLRVLVGGVAYPSGTVTVPTAPISSITNTQLMLNFQNGAIYDNAMMNDLETVGNAQISTSVKKYGTGSLYFDGTGDWLSAPNSPNVDLGSGNFTLECWVYPLNTNNAVLMRKGTAGGFASFQMSTVSGLIVFLASTSGIGFEVNMATAGVSANAWNHVAVVRDSNTYTIYVNGVAGTPSTVSGALVSNTQVVSIGAADNGSSSLNGYIDDLRITKGYARYTATFTPPTAALPNTGP